MYILHCIGASEAIIELYNLSLKKKQSTLKIDFTNFEDKKYSFFHLDGHFRVVDSNRIAFSVAYNRAEEGDEVV